MPFFSFVSLVEDSLLEDARAPWPRGRGVAVLNCYRLPIVSFFNGVFRHLRVSRSTLSSNMFRAAQKDREQSSKTVKGGQADLHVPTSVMSDDENMECPLCMEDMDVSDQNFKPCVCGYQVTKRDKAHARAQL